ncbi:rve-domain-containing protein [Ascobolus immersus RN42]|uniref:Rve-domain-containing protein n=1 Tax=Ascobolus immersus RN42 TaxID=1160509 RepID=A0A3N4HT02_ASCIM|nr:rve-domain-containing protein [Ascobolus immersus RN42]
MLLSNSASQTASQQAPPSANSQTHSDTNPVFSSETVEWFRDYIEKRAMQKRTHLFNRSKRGRYINYLQHPTASLDTTQPGYQASVSEKHAVLRDYLLKADQHGYERLYRVAPLSKAAKSKLGETRSVQERAALRQAELLVVPTTEAFEVISSLHREFGHYAHEKIYKIASERFWGLPRQDIDARCVHQIENQICDLHLQQLNQLAFYTAFILILSTGLRTQMVTGDMSCIFKIISPKFTWLYPLTSKSASEVAHQIMQWIGLGAGEPPMILQCDNETEFKGVLLILLIFFGIKIKNGMPRRPRTQGLVEQANGQVKTRISAYQKEHSVGTDVWAICLALVAMQMNRVPSRVLGGLTPFEVFYGRKPNIATEDRVVEGPGLHLVASQGSSATISDIEDEVIDVTSGHWDPDLDDFIPRPQDLSVLETDLNRFIHASNPTASIRARSNSNQPPTSATIRSSEFQPHNFSNRLPTTQETTVAPHLERTAKQMQQKYSKRHTIKRFALGDIVTLALEDTLRGAGDDNRLVCRVVGIPPENMDGYTLMSRWGILNQVFNTDKLLGPLAVTTSIAQKFPASPTPEELRNLQRVSIAYAASQNSQAKLRRVFCHCETTLPKGACRTIKCPCKRNKVQCSAACHSAKDPARSEISRARCSILAPPGSQGIMSLVGLDSEPSTSIPPASVPESEIIDQQLLMESVAAVEGEQHTVYSHPAKKRRIQSELPLRTQPIRSTRSKTRQLQEGSSGQRALEGQDNEA